MAGNTALGGSAVIAGIRPASASAVSASTPASRSASRSLAPDRSDTSRSGDRPPARTSTCPRSLICLPPSAFWPPLRAVGPLGLPGFGRLVLGTGTPLTRRSAPCLRRALRMVVPEARTLAEREAGPRLRDTAAALRVLAAFDPAPAAKPGNRRRL